MSGSPFRVNGKKRQKLTFDERKKKDAMKLKNIPNGSFLDTINQLQLAIKSVGVYPEDHPITTDIINHSYDALAGHLNAQSTLTLSVLGNKLLVDDLPLELKNNIAAGFALELEHRSIDSISFCRFLAVSCG
jgi:hypothetical protein